MAEKRNWLKSILELGEHTEFITHWMAEAAKYVVGPIFMGLSAAIWAAVKGWDSLWVGIAAIAAIATTLFLVAVVIFLINQVRKSLSPMVSEGKVTGNITESIPAVPNAVEKPPTLREYFNKDFPNCLKVSNQCSLGSLNNENKIDIPWQVCNDFEAGTKFLSFYIPRFPDAYGVCVALSDFTKQTMETVNTGLEIQSKSPGDSSHVDMKDLQFSGRVYLYHENLLSLAELGTLETIYKNKNLFPQFRGSEYSVSRWFQERMAAKN
jgi:hypothetical protein